jgi:hypothetical protein
MKFLPAILAGLHLLLAGFIFGVAIADPMRSAMLPILVYLVDMPCSFLMEWLRHALPQKFLITDAIVYLTVGTAWWYGVGSLLRAGYVRIRSR